MGSGGIRYSGTGCVGLSWAKDDGVQELLSFPDLIRVWRFFLPALRSFQPGWRSWYSRMERRLLLLLGHVARRRLLLLLLGHLIYLCSGNRRVVRQAMGRQQAGKIEWSVSGGGAVQRLPLEDCCYHKAHVKSRYRKVKTPVLVHKCFCTALLGQATIALRVGLAIWRFGRFPERPDDFRPSRPAIFGPVQDCHNTSVVGPGDGCKGRARIRRKIREEKNILNSVVEKYNTMVPNEEILNMDTILSDDIVWPWQLTYGDSVDLRAKRKSFDVVMAVRRLEEEKRSSLQRCRNIGSLFALVQTP
ncbi:hypothetical protein N1851_033774 [Merluccius polli]|uniref:Uncharacterized protein n=1 Tax=Merluccius polli TaxID=89951 RepID=A0AA47M0S6_MERPO|nr:hypothetical protein N1851_033774 [Merluccius polli]